MVIIIIYTGYLLFEQHWTHTHTLAYLHTHSLTSTDTCTSPHTYSQISTHSHTLARTHLVSNLYFSHFQSFLKTFSFQSITFILNRFFLWQRNECAMLKTPKVNLSAGSLIRKYAFSISNIQIYPGSSVINEASEKHPSYFMHVPWNNIYGTAIKRNPWMLSN